MTDNDKARLNVTILSNTTKGLVAVWDGDPQLTYNVASWPFPTGDQVSHEVKGVQSGIPVFERGRLQSIRVTGGNRQGGTTVTPVKEDPPVTPDKPGKVRRLNVTYPGTGEHVPAVELDWPPASGEDIVYKISYWLQMRPENVRKLETADVQCVIDGLELTSDFIYVVQVIATNAGGGSEPVQIHVASHRGFKPSKPPGLTLLTPGSKEVVIQWGRSSSVTYWDVSLEAWSRPQTVSNEDSPLPVTFRLDDLIPGTEYTVQVVAQNFAGVSSETSELTFTTFP